MSISPEADRPCPSPDVLGHARPLAPVTAPFRGLFAIARCSACRAAIEAVAIASRGFSRPSAFNSSPLGRPGCELPGEVAAWPPRSQRDHESVKSRVMDSTVAAGISRCAPAFTSVRPGNQRRCIVQKDLSIDQPSERVSKARPQARDRALANAMPIGIRRRPFDSVTL
jgi:hypothetical protein